MREGLFHNQSGLKLDGLENNVRQFGCCHMYCMHLYRWLSLCEREATVNVWSGFSWNGIKNVKSHIWIITKTLHSECYDVEVKACSRGDVASNTLGCIKGPMFLVLQCLNSPSVWTLSFSSCHFKASQKAQSALIGQLSQDWAGNNYHVSAADVPVWLKLWACWGRGCVVVTSQPYRSPDVAWRFWIRSVCSSALEGLILSQYLFSM